MLNFIFGLVWPIFTAVASGLIVWNITRRDIHQFAVQQQVTALDEYSDFLKKAIDLVGASQSGLFSASESPIARSQLAHNALCDCGDAILRLRRRLPAGLVSSMVTLEEKLSIATSISAAEFVSRSPEYTTIVEASQTVRGDLVAAWNLAESARARILKI